MSKRFWAEVRNDSVTASVLKNLNKEDFPVVIWQNSPPFVMGSVAAVLSSDRTDENTKLIAAAPDTLDACKSIMQLAKYAYGEWEAGRFTEIGMILHSLAGYSKGFHQDIDAMHAAIKKASM